MKHLRGWVVVAALAGLCLAGCSEDPGLLERVNRLQAENQEKDRRLQEAQAALERTKAELKSARAAVNKPVPSAEKPAPAFLPKERLDEGYAAASKELQSRVAGELKNYTVEDCIEYPVTMPTDERPYRSKVVLLVRSDAGRSYRLEFPVSADGSGKWTFPAADEVAGALADTRTQDGNTAVLAPPRNRPSGQNPTPPVVGPASNETRVIDWGDGRSTNQTAPMPPGRPPAPGTPSNKDVQIRW